MGLGEASFCALTAPFIDDYAPPGAKTSWLALFYTMIPTGVAIGFIFNHRDSREDALRSALAIGSDVAAVMPLPAR